MWIGNNFSQVCLYVCLSVQAITFEPLKLGSLFFSVQIHLDLIYFMFEYQGHWIKAKVKQRNDIFYQTLLLYAYIPLKLT